MSPPKVKRHLICPMHGPWQIDVGDNERCGICGVLGEPVCACGCGTSLLGLRSDAVYRSEACAKRLQRRERPDKDPTRHPLQTVREQQAAKKHNRDLGGLIRQAIIDRIKTTGECFADDLIDLYPEGEVKECRRLATAQFGSLAGAGLIVERERRKSKIASRKGAKSGVYEFTKKGRETLVGNSAGGGGASSDACAVSGETGLTGPGSGAGVENPQGPPGNVAPSDAGTAPPDKPLTGVGGGNPYPHPPATSHSGESSAAVSRDPKGSGGAPANPSSPVAAAEPPCLPGFEESAAARHLKDAA